jgi:hypothetical protein
MAILDLDNLGKLIYDKGCCGCVCSICHRRNQKDQFPLLVFLIPLHKGYARRLASAARERIKGFISI